MRLNRFDVDRHVDPAQRELVSGYGGHLASVEGQPVGTRGRDF